MLLIHWRIEYQIDVRQVSQLLNVYVCQVWPHLNIIPAVATLVKATYGLRVEHVDSGKN